jgi:hypothetical protein
MSPEYWIVEAAHNGTNEASIDAAATAERLQAERHHKRRDDERPLDATERLVRLAMKELAQIERACREAA